MGRIGKDLKDQRFGKLVAIAATEKRSAERVIWKCKCDCGNVTEVVSSLLGKYQDQSCGCLSKVNRSGKRYGRLTAIAATDKRSGTHIVWKCICDCGKTVDVSGDCLNRGATRSCGCLNAESRKTHGMRGVAEYSIWIAMRQRCNNPKNKSYFYYGGRGISVCDRWNCAETGLPNFMEDMGPRPSKRHSIDRINNDGDYEPINCHWATLEQQRSNQRPRGEAKASAEKLMLEYYKKEGAKT